MMAMFLRIFPALLLACAPASALAAGKIHYGSRAGMTVTVVSTSGLNTGRATIRTRHTREDAIGFCRDYVGKVTRKCIRRELATPLKNEIRGNCAAGTFTNFFGEQHQYLSETKERQVQAKYAVKKIATGEIADGSSASGYSTNLAIFRALCPQKAPADE